MPNEFTISASLRLSKGNLSRSQSFNGSFTLVASSPAVASGVASISQSAHEAIPMGDVGTAGWAYFQNLDTTNYVEIGKDSTGTFVPFLKLKPGEFQIVRLAISAPYAKANTAAVKLLYEIYDD